MELAYIPRFFITTAVLVVLRDGAGPRGNALESSIDIFDILKLAVSVIAVIVPALWSLSSKLSKVEATSGEINAKMENMEKDIVNIREYCEKLDMVDRDGRKQLWQEVNSARERLPVVETKKNSE